jgi:hypothetical protein
VRVGDIVRPRSPAYKKDQIGFVIMVGIMGGIGVRLFNGKIVTYNRGALEVISESK